MEMMRNALQLWSLHLSLPFFLLLHHVSSALVASDSVYDTFLNCLQKHTNHSEVNSNILYAQTNAKYSTLLGNYIRNARFKTPSTRKPLLIVTPSHESHVEAVVVCSQIIGLQIRIRSGGHDYEGVSYVSYDMPFILLDMFNLKTIAVDIDDGSVWVQAGATLGELYYSIWEKSKVHGFPAGVCSTVGVGGHISGGGYGTMMRKYGLSVDNVLDANIVDVNGKVLDRKSMGEDLFWAIRGGGGASFGVVLSYKLKLVPVPETVTVFGIETTLDQNSTMAIDIVYRWQEVAPSTDDGLFMRMILEPVSSNVKKGEKTIRASIYALYLGKAERLVSLLEKEFPELGLNNKDCREMGWIDSVLWWNKFPIENSPDALLNRNLNSANLLKRKSDYVQNPISKDGLEWIFKKMVESGKIGLALNPYGGKMSQISASETPFPHRAGNLYKIQYSVNWHREAEEANSAAQIRRLYGYMTPFVSKNTRSAFLNYRDLDIGINTHGNDSYTQGMVYGLKYFHDNFHRLVKVKTAVDPDNFFRNQQSIPTLPSKRHSHIG
ncbi:berberine bridge enzyme-like 21 [Ziziphus jujuba]|uniref:Berberine bridge enzyme-like 21 n=1 Tax=Ziziphus jujuba TaxID=326968 RepID=A0A6P3ZCR4_ZIZJJ|nr:berberine bridge enzyme-like 21 [Ziziphus jujuba]